MDVHCATCREPWDAYHLRHDAIWETNLSEKQVEMWDGKLSPHIRAEFKTAGYIFGPSVYALHQCPACIRLIPPSPDAKERMLGMDVIAQMLGDDEDGIIAELSDYGESE